MITRMGQLGKKLDEILENHDDVIIHTGSYQGENKSIANPERYLWNVQNTFKYLEQARKEKKKFVYVSTWDENPNPYVESKRTCERMILEWRNTYLLNAIIIRIPSIIGRGVIHKFIETDKELEINDRELEFETLNYIAEEIKKIISCRFLNTYENSIDCSCNNHRFRIYGRKISVQLLYDLIRYTARKIKNENSN